MQKPENKNQGVPAAVVRRWARPRRILIKYTDPFDGTWLATSDYSYNARLSADGFYTRGIKIMRDGLKKIQSHILQGRTPRVSVTLVV